MLKSINSKNFCTQTHFCGGSVLLENGAKNTKIVVLNNRRHLLDSHNKQIQLGSLQDR